MLSHWWLSELRETIDNFEWRTWRLSDWRVCVGLSLAYLLGVLFLKFVAFKNCKLELKWFSWIHNIILTLSSAVMMIGVIWGCVEMTRKYGVVSLHCLQSSDSAEIYMRGPLFFWVYVYYLSKYYEFLDTLILILKGKPLSFLHVFHHSSVPLVALLFFYAEWPGSWFGSVENCFVHVVMYLYFSLSSFGCGWLNAVRRYITRMQITQFILAVVMVNAYFIQKHALGYPCAGNGIYLSWGIFCTCVYLVLFVKFYVREYRASRSAPKSE